MPFPTETVGQYVVVRLDGQIMGPQSHDLEKQLMELMGKGHYYIALDLEDVKFLDSSAIGAFVYVLIPIREKGGVMAVIGATDMIQDMLEASNTTKLLEVFASQSEFKAAKEPS